MNNQRYWINFGLVLLLFALTGWIQGWSLALNILTIGLISAVMALGLNIQWGYAGLFNAGVMGFAAIGAIACVLVSMPWVSDVMQIGLEDLLKNQENQKKSITALQLDLSRRLVAEQQIGLAWVIGAISALVAWLMNRLLRYRVSSGIRIVLVVVVLSIGLILFRGRFDDAIHVIESTGLGDNSKYLGGLGFPIIIAWFVGGGLAALAAWIIGKIALGLRSDYLAIATLGISEIVIALLKNEGWLTRGVLNVTGLPSLVPSVKEFQLAPYNLDLEVSLLMNKLAFLIIVILFLIVFLWLAARALHSPWGRMMRAIRDDEEAASAMGKNVVLRHRQVFIFGSFLLGIGGAMLATLFLQFEPAGYNPLRFTFLIWVMVIVGGSGNNLGSVIGGLLIWFIWIQAEPSAYWVFNFLGDYVFDGEGEAAQILIERAPQMRTLVMGFVLLIVLRYAPRGILPEALQRK
tara:strand:+ start:4273 stop:5658 length:1386 start_codon:yes stop_codon:yes gene_type:complete